MYLQNVISKKTWRSISKIARSGAGSNGQRQGSVDLDPYQNITDPQHCFKSHVFSWQTWGEACTSWWWQAASSPSSTPSPWPYQNLSISFNLFIQREQSGQIGSIAKALVLGHQPLILINEWAPGLTTGLPSPILAVPLNSTVSLFLVLNLSKC